VNVGSDANGNDDADTDENASRVKQALI
jgi:hypothetical protein